MISENPLITVFTPTYNRAKTIHRAWESLINQTYKNFEWLIIDDESNDGTDSLIENWKKIADFPVHYYRFTRQKNAGKHVAWNRAGNLAHGELIVCLDSDDACKPESLEFFVKEWKGLGIRANEFAYIAVLCTDQNGKLRGTRFPYYRTESDHNEIHWKFGVSGDKWECYRKEVFQAYPQPEPNRPGAIPEGIILSRMAKKYKNLYINECMRIYFYDGADLSTVNTVDPKKHAWGKFLFATESLWAYPEWHFRAPWYFIVMALRVNRTVQLLHLPKSTVTAHLPTCLSRLWVAAFYLPGRFIGAVETLFSKNLQGIIIH